ncbi:mitochondrial inner membrane protein OXA1L isoform X1 [Cotesia glomerata]|uniref:mitochondrial inner membrane protein OXA1L isoform X1 n=1 Tax=Cotesia glomerata TaxID=32391 RepID=UPI001D026CB4|nr:mitochondrial inner membrane protein OXA1L isoform X1 [Cotesia glomerata]XP_044577438.1 mitochondrial inner membrane protein OXA1L isoform X1 [Cotesia glomerata]
MLSRVSRHITNYSVSQTHVISQKLINRSMHLSCRVVNKNFQVRMSKFSPSTSFVRAISTEGADIKSTEAVNNIQLQNSTPAVPLEAIPADILKDAISAGTDPVLARDVINYINRSAKIKEETAYNRTDIFTNPSVNHMTGQNQAAENLEDIAAELGISDSIKIAAEIPVLEASKAPASKLIDAIPDIPVAPPISVEEIVAATNALGEPTLASVGLGGWWPTGIAQQYLELIHVSLDLPWWATIALGTVIVRTMLFPLVIISQRNAAHLHNTLPEMQKIQSRITEARINGDQLQVARLTQELMLFMSGNNCNPLKSIIVPLCQAPIFISFFFGMKGMTNLPLESMRHGGLLWFTDLTVTDPYYLLPVLTSVTLAATIRLGIDGPKLESMGMMKYVVQAIPIIILPFSINFPSAIVWYWTTTNFFSLLQAAILKIPKIREWCKIPKQIQHAPGKVEKKNFREGFQDSWKNMKSAREVTDRQHLDMVQFNKFGRGPIPKTYAYNPVEGLKKSAVASKRR